VRFSGPDWRLPNLTKIPRARDLAKSFPSKLYSKRAQAKPGHRARTSAARQQRAEVAPAGPESTAVRC